MAGWIRWVGCVICVACLVTTGCPTETEQDVHFTTLREAILDFRIWLTNDEGIPLECFVTEHIDCCYKGVDYYGSYQMATVRFDYCDSDVDFIMTFYWYIDDPTGWFW